MILYLILYLLSVPIGFLLTAYFLRHNQNKIYFWYDYAALFILPTATFYLLYKNIGPVVIVIFLAWIIFGPLLEATVGWAYLGIRGKHLWVYERYPILNKTSSWLTLPFWAFAGLGIWSVNQLLSSFFR